MADIVITDAAVAEFFSGEENETIPWAAYGRWARDFMHQFQQPGLY